MKKVIIEGNEETRVVWYLEESIYPFHLEKYDLLKGWRPNIVFDSILKAIAVMEMCMEEDKKRKEEEE